MRGYRSFSGIACCLLIAVSAWAAPPAIPVLEPVVVTARGRESRSSATPGGVGIVYPEDIFERQPASLTDVTTRIPGVDKSADSAWGADILIRGLGRNRVILLIDGCRVNTATDINAQFGLLDPMEIERIEVLKGPISSLYGSGAVGGVVNVITRKGSYSAEAEWHGTLAAAYWTNPAGPNFYGNASAGTGDAWGYVSASRRDHASYRDGGDVEIPNSQFDDDQGKVHLGIKWNPQQQSEFQVQRYRANEVGVPGTGLAALPVQSAVTYPHIRRTLWQFSHVMSPESPVFKESHLNAYYQKIERNVRIDNFPSGPLLQIRPEADHDTIGLKWQNRLQFSAHALVTGIDLWHWQYSGTRTRQFSDGTKRVDMPLADSEQFSGGIFAEDDWELDPSWTLNGGARADYITEKSEPLYAGIVPPGPLLRPAEAHADISWEAHAGLTWRFRPRWTMTALGASSYRTPDLLDRFKYIFFTTGNELFGNPDLAPERSLFFEYGLHYNAPDVHLTASAFFNHLRNLIVDPSPGQGIRALENLNKAEIYGAEVEGQWNLGRRWSLYANLAFARGRDITANEDLAFIPPFNGLGGVRFDAWRGFWSSFEVDWAARQNRVPPGGETTGGWVTVNADVGYRRRVGSTWHEITLGAHNLLDAQYRNHLSTSRGIALTEPGINLTAAWRMEF